MLTNYQVGHSTPGFVGGIQKTEMLTLSILQAHTNALRVKVGYTHVKDSPKFHMANPL